MTYFCASDLERASARASTALHLVLCESREVSIKIVLVTDKFDPNLLMRETTNINAAIFHFSDLLASQVRQTQCHRGTNKSVPKRIVIDRQKQANLEYSRRCL